MIGVRVSPTAARLLSASGGGGIDVDAILATGGASCYGSYSSSAPVVDTTDLLSLEGSASAASVLNPGPDNVTIMLFARNLSAQLKYADGGDEVTVFHFNTSVDGFDSLFIAVDLGDAAVKISGTSIFAAASSALGEYLTARLRDAAGDFSQAPLSVSGGLQANTYVPQIVAGDVAVVVIPSALTAEEMDAIYAATVFPA